MTQNLTLPLLLISDRELLIKGRLSEKQQAIWISTVLPHRRQASSPHHQIVIWVCSDSEFDKLNSNKTNTGGTMLSTAL